MTERKNRRTLEETATFGEILRRLRQAANLTQDMLAEQSGLSTTAIAALERGRSAAPRPDTVKLLVGALDLESEDRDRLLTAAAAARDRLATVVPPREPASSPPASHSVGAPGAGRHVPVPPTALIGREHEEAALVHLLQQDSARPAGRLVTLVGPGGVGKTRLAFQIALSSQDSYDDGVYFVDLSSLQDPALVVSAVAQALGLQEDGAHSARERVVAWLGDKHLLLVLDNFEHVIDAATFLADLIQTCPNLTILVTSRTALHIRAERQFRLFPLTAPDPESSSVSELSVSPAVQLFVERARAIRPDFILDEENAATVAAICWRLDGLPLAIELAAARVRLLPPAALLARLEHRLAVLTAGARDLPARQQTLRNTIAWSYSLLDASEQGLFCRLAVFSGGFSLEAVEAVCGTPGSADTLDVIASLTDKSLVQALGGPGDSPRFSMLETIREYAWEELQLSGDAHVVQHRHAAFFVALAEQAESHLQGPDQAAWLECLEREHDNLRSALRWARESGDHVLELRLAGALWYFWFVHGHLREGLGWLDGLRTTLEPQRYGPIDPGLRARTLAGASWLAYVLCDYPHATALAEESLALYRRLGNKLGTATALTTLSVVALDQGDYERATLLQEEALHLQEEVGDRWWIAASLNNLGMIAGLQGDNGRARALQQETLALRRSLGDTRGTASALENLGTVAMTQGAALEASDLFREGLALHRALGDSQAMIVLLEELAEALAHRDPAAAARLLGAAGEQRRRRALSSPPYVQAAANRAATCAREALGPDGFDLVLAEGRSLTLDQAAAYALNEV